MLRFRFLTGDVSWKEYGGKFISRKMGDDTAHDWPYWLVIEVTSIEGAVGEKAAREMGKYLVNLSAVAPKAVSAKEMELAKQSCGWEGMPDTEITTAEMLHSYGTRAVIWEDIGNNLAVLLKKAHDEANTMGDMFFGFAMDKQANALGATGWDFIAGNPLGSLKEG